MCQAPCPRLAARPEADEGHALDAGRPHPVRQQGAEQIRQRRVLRPRGKLHGLQPPPGVDPLQLELGGAWQERLQQVVELLEAAVLPTGLRARAGVVLELKARNRVVGVEGLALVGSGAVRDAIVVPDGHAVEAPLAERRAVVFALGRDWVGRPFSSNAARKWSSRRRTQATVVS